MPKCGQDVAYSYEISTNSSLLTGFIVVNVSTVDVKVVEIFTDDMKYADS